MEPISGVISKIFRTIARGFFLGIGFSIAIGLAYFVAWQTFISKVSEEMNGASNMAANVEANSKSIVLSEIEELKHDSVTSIVGSAKNTGGKEIRGVQVQVNFFNHGKFVDQYSAYVSGKFAPGESKPFKISCGCKDTPAAEHDSYKVEVINSY